MWPSPPTAIQARLCDRSSLRAPSSVGFSISLWLLKGSHASSNLARSQATLTMSIGAADSVAESTKEYFS